MRRELPVDDDSRLWSGADFNWFEARYPLLQPAPAPPQRPGISLRSRTFSRRLLRAKMEPSLQLRPSVRPSVRRAQSLFGSIFARLLPTAGGLPSGRQQQVELRRRLRQTSAGPINQAVNRTPLACCLSLLPLTRLVFQQAGISPPTLAPSFADERGGSKFGCELVSERQPRRRKRQRRRLDARV